MCTESIVDAVQQDSPSGSEVSEAGPSQPDNRQRRTPGSRLAETPECRSLEFQLDATFADNLGHICRQIMYDNCNI